MTKAVEDVAKAVGVTPNRVWALMREYWRQMSQDYAGKIGRNVDDGTLWQLVKVENEDEDEELVWKNRRGLIL